MKKFNFKDLFPALVLVIICFATAALLSVTNTLTLGRINALAEQNKIESMNSIFPNCTFDFKETLFEEKTIEYAVAYGETGETVGFIFTLSGNGYGGEVTAMTGINNVGNITAVRVINASDETPGLGQKVAENEFLEQFMGKSGEITVKTGENSVDAVTGATISSKAVTNLVNDSLSIFEFIKNGEGK